VEDHVIHVHDILGRLERAGFTLNPEKMTLRAKEIKYLGHILSPRGIKILPERIAVIQSYPRPKNLRDLRKCLGMIGFYGQFIPGSSGKAAVLHGLKRKGIQFDWHHEHQLAFEQLKNALCKALCCRSWTFLRILF
jgi:hypothetical protein